MSEGFPIKIITGPLPIPLWRQWAFSWTTPGTINFMVPGCRIYVKAPRLPKGTIIHLTAGQWKSSRFYLGRAHRWIVAREDEREA